MNRQQRRAAQRQAVKQVATTTRQPSVQEAARAALQGLALRHGAAWERATTIAPFGAKGECWSNAWHGEGDYVEGAVSRLAPDGTVQVGTHAWNVVDGQVVERTPTYEQAFGYVGIVIDRDKHRAKTADWGLTRSSVTEALYGAGFMYRGHLLHDDDVLTFLSTGEPPR